jgi:hypothetical protein
MLLTGLKNRGDESLAHNYVEFGIKWTLNDNGLTNVVPLSTRSYISGDVQDGPRSRCPAYSLSSVSLSSEVSPSSEVSLSSEVSPQVRQPPGSFPPHPNSSPVNKSRRTRAESQQIVVQDYSQCLQYPVPYLSRMQRIYVS